MVLVQLLLWKRTIDTISVVSIMLMPVQAAGMLLTILPTERALKKNF